MGYCVWLSLAGSAGSKQLGARGAGVGSRQKRALTVLSLWGFRRSPWRSKRARRPRLPGRFSISGCSGAWRPRGPHCTPRPRSRGALYSFSCRAAPLHLLRRARTPHWESMAGGAGWRPSPGPRAPIQPWGPPQAPLCTERSGHPRAPAPLARALSPAMTHPRRGPAHARAHTHTRAAHTRTHSGLARPPARTQQPARPLGPAPSPSPAAGSTPAGFGVPDLPRAFGHRCTARRPRGWGPSGGARARRPEGRAPGRPARGPRPPRPRPMGNAPSQGMSLSLSSLMCLHA